MSRRRPAPLLRSPPFPGIDRKVAAISARARGVALDSGDAGLDRLVAAIAEARVGGSFWAPPVETAPTLVIRPWRDGWPASIARAAAIAEPAATLAVLPAGAADDPVRGAGIGVAREPVDPWSLLRPGVRLLAEPGDEWASIAALAGAEVIGAAPATLRRALAHALFEDIAYRDCFADRPAAPEEAVAILAGWRRLADLNRPIAAATGIAWWKRAQIRRFFWLGHGGEVAVLPDAAGAVAAAARAGGGVAVWPSRMPPGLEERAAAAGVPLIAVEDGFIRSVGLGSDLHPPWSIVADRRGIYYDPGRPSDLEHLLVTAPFPPALVARAARLRETIVARGISKYASGGSPAAPARAADRRVVLVAGQVEDDASVKAAGAGVAGNLDLLRRARAAEPEAHLIFKPHPDVDAGHRVGGIADAEALRHADEVVRDEAMPALLARVDAVHVLTSLTGFEALLRGREVTTHGHPFYAGWGLTRDLAGAPPRRGRPLALDELVAATLILYPRYLDPATGLPCPPEILLDRLARQARPKAGPLIRARRLQGRIARFLGTTSD